MQKTKLQNLLNILSPDGTSVDFKAFDENIATLKAGLKQKIQATTLDDVNKQLTLFRKSLDFTPLFTSIENIEKNLDARIVAVTELLKTETTDFQSLLKENNGITDQKITDSTSGIQVLRDKLNSLKAQKDGEIKDLRSRLDQLPVFIKRVDDTFASLQKTMAEDAVKDEKEMEDMTKMCVDEVEKLRRELTNRINNMPRGGGNANRNIAIGGDTSVLSTFTDINLKPGNNVTISYAKNQTTKYTDVTITATGGSGTTRSINSIAVGQTAGATAGTDYVYVCTAALTLTLPTAVGNTNLYTVKNTSNGTITVDTTSVQTIDGDPTVVMPVKYTSVDLISDGSNWQIT